MKAFHEVELLSQEECDPSERIELRVYLKIVTTLKHFNRIAHEEYQTVTRLKHFLTELLKHFNKTTEAPKMKILKAMVYIMVDLNNTILTSKIFN